MISVVILGSGNMAWHLYHAFKTCTDVRIIQHYHYKKQDNLFKESGIPFTSDLQQLKPADFYILAINDDSIAEISAQLPVLQGIVLHTSGAVSIEALDKKNRTGVFYPLQTLTKSRPVDFSTIPVCIEAEKAKDLELIKVLATKISKHIYTINSDQRRSLHLAAVFTNNFVNHLYQLAYEICEEEGLQTQLLTALILETSQKAIDVLPENAQTGPAKRGDFETMKKHLEKLSGNHKTIYKTISESILSTYGREKL